MGYQVCQDVRFSGRSFYINNRFPVSMDDEFTESVCGEVSPTTDDAYTSFNQNLQSRISNCSINSLSWSFQCKEVVRIGQPEIRTLGVSMNLWDIFTDAIVASGYACMHS